MTLPCRHAAHVARRDRRYIGCIFAEVKGRPLYIVARHPPSTSTNRRATANRLGRAAETGEAAQPAAGRREILSSVSSERDEGSVIARRAFPGAALRFRGCLQAEIPAGWRSSGRAIGRRWISGCAPAVVGRLRPPCSERGGRIGNHPTAGFVRTTYASPRVTRIGFSTDQTQFLERERHAGDGRGLMLTCLARSTRLNRSREARATHQKQDLQRKHRYGAEFSGKSPRDARAPEEDAGRLKARDWSSSY